MATRFRIESTRLDLPEDEDETLAGTPRTPHGRDEDPEDGDRFPGERRHRMRPEKGRRREDADARTNDFWN